VAIAEIHQCPLCGLRFALRAELTDHARTDHLPVAGDDLPGVDPFATGTVVVPVDPDTGESLAVRVAAVLARQAGMGLEVVAVPHLGLAGPVDLARATATARSVGAPGVRGRVLSPSGGVVRVVLGRAAEPDVALLCMATRARHAADDLLATSVSISVIRSSQVPVVLVGPSVERADDCVRRVVVCVDGSEFAERAAPVGAALAERLAADVVLLQVTPRQGPQPPERPELAYLLGLAETLPCPAAFDLIEGERPAAAIARYARRDEGTLVALATHGRSGIRTAVWGSVARDVARSAPCPVLVVPRGAALTGPSPARLAAPTERT
jgi:nucleotide-binding universal stress UspA family protein